ncbi:hypothetical protein ACOSQ2_001137 [Xanthoceras sorbifolium]
MINKQVLLALGKKGEIGGAGLDVFENELEVPKELFDLDNFVLSPHRSVLIPDSLKNLEAFFSDKPTVGL